MTTGLRDWYRTKRVLVTGHTGFKGAWLIGWLRAAGASVTGYSLPPPAEGSSLFTAAKLSDGIESIYGDVRDRHSLLTTVMAARPEIVFHLAAQSLVRPSYRDPVGTYEANVMGTVHLLDAIRQTSSVQAVVVVTSDKCYENREIDRPYHEDDPMGGHDPYSSSKGCAELVTAAMRRSFFDAGGAAIATARAGNVIGGGDWSVDRLVPDLMRAATAGREALIRNPDAVRPWQFVLDPLNGYLMLGRGLAEQGRELAEGWNFGPSDARMVSVRDVATVMHDAWPRVVVRLEPDPSAPHEAGILQLSSAKARARLGWESVVPFAEAVRLTVGWYRRYYEDPTSAPALVAQQWDDYEAIDASYAR